MEQELKALIEEYRDLVKGCIDRVDELESMLMDGLLNPVRQEMERAELKRRKDAFVEEVGDKLSVFDKKLRIIEKNPDFSLNDVAFDEYDNLEVNEGEEKPTATEFADKMVELVTEQINELTNALNAADSPEEVEEKAEEAKEAIDEAVEEKKEELEGTDVKGEGEEKVEVEVKEGEDNKEPSEEEVEETEEKKTESEELTEEDKEELRRMKENLHRAMGVYGA